MLKKLALSATILIGFAAPALAGTAWVGNAFVTAAATVCGDTASVGDYASLIYRPAGSALGNTGDSYLSYVGTRSSLSMVVYNNTFRAGLNYASNYVSSYLKFGSGSGGVTAWSMSPATLGAGTTTATLTATISNFYNIAGCIVSLRSDLERVP